MKLVADCVYLYCRYSLVYLSPVWPINCFCSLYCPFPIMILMKAVIQFLFATFAYHVIFCDYDVVTLNIEAGIA